MKTFRTTGTGSEQTLSEIETDKIPLYPTEQDLLDDLANLEVGQIAGTIDPAESELIGVLIQRIQALESKLESDDVYSTDEIITNKKWWNGTEWKTVYRKRYVGNGTLGLILVQGVEDLVSCGGWVTFQNQQTPFPFDVPSNTFSIRKNTSNDLRIANDFSANCNIWFEYTKIDESL